MLLPSWSCETRYGTRDLTIEDVDEIGRPKDHIFIVKEVRTLYDFNDLKALEEIQLL